MWSRSTPKAPALPPLPSPGASGHHRRSSSGTKSASSSTAAGAGDKGKKKLRKNVLDAGTTLEEGSDDSDVWAGDSDDETTRTALAAAHRRLGSVSLSAVHGDSVSADGPTNGAKEHAPATSSAGASSLAMPSLRSASSWSFNPFSIISPSPKQAEPATLPALAGAEAVAAVLAGATIPAAINSSSRNRIAPEITKNSTDASNKEPSAQPAVEPDPDEVEDEVPPPIERRGSNYQMDLWKAAIKPDVDEIVKGASLRAASASCTLMLGSRADPVALLSRLNQCPPPVPTPIAPLHAKSLSVSISRREYLPGEQDDADEDEDPAAGYVPLNALNLSSGAPEIVEFGKEEETVEDMGERGREKRRRGRFIDCLGADNVDLSESGGPLCGEADS